MADDHLKELELFNAHQEDTRRQTEFLAKSVFLMGGTALTISINLFIGEKAPAVPDELVVILRLAWCLLFASIAGYVLVLSVMLIRDYHFGERWRSALNGKRGGNPDNGPGWPDRLMWGLGAASICCFLFGLGTLAWVSSSLVGPR